LLISDETIVTDFDAKKFRAALGQYATGVAIVTAQAPGKAPVGMTINSFASVSLDPPLILWSVQSDSPSAAHFLSAPSYAITILSADQEALAKRFAKTDDFKFEGVETRQGRTGIPIIPGGIAEFECEVESIVAAGDHDIIIGRVIHFNSDPAPALGFHSGKFMRFDG
jgi:flavin reductase (DIM6/NTAB) family NADH-FMN oxidoreductase RutF